MTAEHILEAVGLLDDDLIREAEEYSRPKVRCDYRRWAGLAACAALVLALGYGVTHLRMAGQKASNGMSGGATCEPAASVPAGGEALPSGSGGSCMDEGDIPAPALPEPDSTNGGENLSPPEENICPAIMVDGVLYFSTGEPIPGEPDPSAIRTVVSYTSGVPEMDNQTNFSQDLSAQYAVVEMGGEQKLAVLMEQEWILFDTVPPRA